MGTSRDWHKFQRNEKVRLAPRPPRRPSKNLPPTGAFGKCPECGKARWWDNRPKKKSGQWKSSAPDMTCAECGYRVWSYSEWCARLAALKADKNPLPGVDEPGPSETQTQSRT